MSAPPQSSQTQSQNPFNIQTDSQPIGFQPQPQFAFGSPDQLQSQPQPQALFGIGNSNPPQQPFFGANSNFQSNANVQKMMNIQQAPKGNQSFPINNSLFAQQLPANPLIGANSIGLNQSQTKPQPQSLFAANAQIGANSISLNQFQSQPQPQPLFGNAQQQAFGANPNLQSNANVQKMMNIPFVQQAPMENNFGLNPFQSESQPQPLFGNAQQQAFGANPNFQSNANVQKVVNIPIMQQVPMGNKSSAMNNNLFVQQIPSINQIGISSMNSSPPLFPGFGAQNSKMLEEIVQKEVISDEKAKEPIVSIIITIYAGASYDNLFRDVQQVVVGGRITLYSLSLLEVGRFYDCLIAGKAETDNKDFNDVMNKILAELSDIEPDCVLFNFECCSSCSEKNYHFAKAESTLQLIKHTIDKGHYVMCSDFAVHALINDWKEDLLGPNPFIHLGNCNQFIELNFNPDDLKASKSKQLQMVGDLCQKGTTSIHALGGTVVFGIQKAKADNKVYSLEILTIVTNTSGFNFKKNEENFGRIGEKKGPIGHAVLKYKSGGLLMVSSGHWIELKNLDVDIENFEKVAEMNYGKNNAYVEELRSMKNAPVEERKKKVQMFSAQFVQQTTNCNYSSKRMTNF